MDAPTYDCSVADDVCYLDVAGVHDKAAGTLTLFVLNRHLTETADLDVSLTGFGSPSLAEHLSMEGYGLNDTNGPDKPDNVVPGKGQALAWRMVSSRASLRRFPIMSCG